MLKQKLQQMQQIQAFIDSLNEAQIRNLITKQHFQAAQQYFQEFQNQESFDDQIIIDKKQQLASIETDNQFLFNYQSSNKFTNSFVCNKKTISANLLLMIQDKGKHSEIQKLNQIQNRFKMLACSGQNCQEAGSPDFIFELHKNKATQQSQVRYILRKINQDQNQIKNSGLKASDFKDIYQSIAQQPINDPIVRKIITYFQTSTKEFSLYQFIKTVEVYLSQKLQNREINQIQEKKKNLNQSNKQIIDESIIQGVDRVGRIYASLSNVMTKFEQ